MNDVYGADANELSNIANGIAGDIYKKAMDVATESFLDLMESSDVDEFFSKEDIISYASNEFEPRDIFDLVDLEEEVERASSVDDVFDDSEIIEYVSSNIEVHRVFDTGEIIDYVTTNWAMWEVYGDDTFEEAARETVQHNSVGEIFTDERILSYVREHLLDELVDDVTDLIAERKESFK